MIMDILFTLLFAALLGQGEPNNCSANFCQRCVIQGPINCTITNGTITCLQPQDSSRCSEVSPNCHTIHVNNPNNFRPGLCYILLSVNQSQFSFLSSENCGKEENGTCYTNSIIPVASTKECEISLNEDPRMLDPQTYRCDCNTDNCNSQIVIHYPSTTPVTSPTQASPPVTSPTQASPLLQYGTPPPLPTLSSSSLSAQTHCTLLFHSQYWAGDPHCHPATCIGGPVCLWCSEEASHSLSWLERCPAQAQPQTTRRLMMENTPPHPLISMSYDSLEH